MDPCASFCSPVGRMAAGSESTAGCVAAEDSAQPVAIIGHACSMQTLNCKCSLVALAESKIDCMLLTL